MSFILTPQLVSIAVNAVKPTFNTYHEAGLVKRGDLWIVVMNPTVSYDSVTHFDMAVLSEHKFGEPDPLYRRVARSKAEVSWRTGKPSHMVQQTAPFLLLERDTKWGGSAVTPEGLTVACSGVEWYMDQHMSEMIASAIKALSLKKMQEIMESDTTFLGEDS